MNLSDLKEKKIAVLGVGLENVFLAQFLFENGVTDLELRDQKSGKEIKDNLSNEAQKIFVKLCHSREDGNPGSVRWKFGSDYLEDLDKFDVIFRTPGLSYLTSEIQAAKKAGVIISSQIKLFFDLCPAKIIGVTGTKGKGTTAKLIESILQNQKSKIKNQNKGFNNIYLLGNIGRAAVSELKSMTKCDIVILELSSFQLQDLDKSPHIAVVTNIGDDHLDYHQDLEEYWAAKANILNYQSSNDFAVINQDYLTAVELAASTNAKIYYFSGKNPVDKGAFLRQNQKSKIKNQKYGKELLEVVVRMDDKQEVICRSDELIVVGRHNLENIAAASIVAKILGVPTEIISSTVKKFKGLEHRLEFVAKKNGIDYYNDSFATNPVSTLAAIRSFDQPIILILGGSEKHSNYSDLVKEIKDNEYVKQVVYIGKTGQRLSEMLKESGFGHLVKGRTTMPEIVKIASNLAQPGDVILLSTASASFDLFKNYKDRGEKFKQAVQNLS